MWFLRDDSVGFSGPYGFVLIFHVYPKQSATGVQFTYPYVNI